jgi:hypothetical protein
MFYRGLSPLRGVKSNRDRRSLRLWIAKAHTGGKNVFCAHLGVLVIWSLAICVQTEQGTQVDVSFEKF